MPTPTLSAATTYASSAGASLTHTFNHTADIGDGLLVCVYTLGNSSAGTVSFGSQSLTTVRNEVTAWFTSALTIWRLAAVTVQGTQTVTITVAGASVRNVVAFVYNTRYVQSYDYLVLADDNISQTTHNLPAMTGTSNDRLLGVYVDRGTPLGNVEFSAPNGTVLNQLSVAQSLTNFLLAVLEETSEPSQVITATTATSVPSTALGIRLTGVTQANFKRQFFPVN